MQLIDQANALHNQISDVYNQAYQALQMANITLGICGRHCKVCAGGKWCADFLPQRYGGVEIPTVTIDTSELQMLLWL